MEEKLTSESKGEEKVVVESKADKAAAAAEPKAEAKAEESIFESAEAVPGALSPEELARRAKEELGETPEVREKAMKELEARVAAVKKGDEFADVMADLQNEKNFNARKRICFLRNAKFDVEKAINKAVKYYRFQRELAKMGPDDGPLPVRTWMGMKPLLDLAFFEFLPGYNKKGQKVMAVCDVSNMEQMFGLGCYEGEKIMLLMLDFMLLYDYMIEDEQTSICGMCIIEDIKNYSISMVWRLKSNPHFIELDKQGLKMMQDALPLRIGNMWLLDMPWYFNIIWMLIRPFMKQKLRERVHMITRKDLDQIYEEDFLREHMPPHFNGTMERNFEAFIKARIEEEGHVYVPGGKFAGVTADTWSEDQLCTEEELQAYKGLLKQGLQVFKRDRHGRKQTRVLYSLDDGATVNCAEKVGSDKAKSFPVKEITDIKEAADEDYFELIHPKRTLAIGCGTKAARDLMVKRLRGLVMMAAQEGLPSMSDDIGSKAGVAS